jgi:FecR-like protein
MKINFEEALMKYIHAFVSTAVCIVVLAFAASASAQTIKDGVVTVVRIQGTARYSSGDNVWHPLSPGKTLGASDVVQTASDSTVDLVLGEKAVQISSQSGVGTGFTPVGGIGGDSLSAPEQNVVRLQPDSMLAIDKFTFSKTGADTVSDTELDLRAGKIFGNVKKISAASQYLVKMPGGVAGIRGTIFILGSDGSVTVLSGSVVISVVGTNGQVFTTVLGAGQTFDPQTQQVTRLTPRSFVAELRNATAIIVAIHSLVTVVETPTATGKDTTVIYISPTSGKR